MPSGKVKSFGSKIADGLNIDDFSDVLRTVADVGVTGIALASGAITGYEEFRRKGVFFRPVSAFSSGITKGVATFGTINNTANMIYYNWISNGESDLTSTSYSDGGVARYINRWDRLDYTKQQTQQSNYNFNAWMYYSEYNFHMYIWNITSWADEKDIPIFSSLAGSAKDAAVDSEDPFSDYNYYMQKNDPITAVLRTVAYMATGILGI